jgi:hypothetical protein
MGSAPDTALGPRVFGADYFSNRMYLFKLVQIFDLVSTFSWLLQFGDLLNCFCISVAFLGTKTKIMEHASIQ